MENLTTSALNSSTSEQLIPCTSPGSFTAVLFKGYLSGFLCLMAIFGNSLCMFVLSTSSMRSSSVSRILLTLSCTDFIYGVSALLMFCMEAFCKYYCIWDSYHYWVFPVISPSLYAISVTVQFASVYLTVLVSFERYIAVCHPLQAKLRCSPMRSTRWSIFIVLFSVFFHLSTWWETEAVPVSVGYAGGDILLGYKFDYTDLYNHPIYFKYYVKWGTFMVLRFIPFTVLIVLNAVICNTIVRMNRQRQTMSQTQIKEISITKMLLAVILVFLLCNFLKIVMYMTNSTKIETFWVYLSDFLVIANAGLNFIIYGFFSKVFRTASKDILCQLFCWGH